MSAQALPRTGFKFLISVKSGPDQGSVFQLLPPRVTIGRGSDSNVTLKDPKVSRNAAVIEFAMDKITIVDVSSRSALQVNGSLVSSASIRNSDLIRIGETEFQFIVEAVQLAPPVPRAPGNVVQFPQAPPPPPNFDSFEARAPKSQSSAQQGNSKTTFYIVVAVVGGILVWLLNSTPPEKPAEPTLRTNEAIEKDIASSEERVLQIVKHRTFKSDEEKTRYEEAQRHYVSGFRDYQKGQWLRAMRSFETARAIDPEHELALRYMRLAEKQRDEMVALLTLEGRRYKEKNMYGRCSAALDKALEAIPNKSDVKFKEAEALKKECDLLAAERFQ
ncbi:MAG TPA: FHA domain-containing protein [Bdellovibrionales bacterium]|nr:FHA domain-containing protein [Bdellovibrionales bacterium]